MNSETKQGCEVWSTEDIGDEEDESGKRCYICVYCKRGFTNAQALGGHMNIHRKDRAKAKQQLVTPNSCSSSNINIPNNKFQNDQSVPLPNNFLTEFSSNPMHYYRDMYFHPPPPPQPPNNLLTRNQFHAPAREFHDPMSWPLNLSLQIGPTSYDPVDQNNNQTTEVLDLELRLGHHP